MSDFSVRHRREDGGVLVTVTGEIDSGNAEQFRLALDDILADHPEGIAFELDEVGFMGSSGLAVLVHVRGAARSMEIRGASPIVRRVIEVTGLAEHLHLHPSLLSAIRSRAVFAPDPVSVPSVRRFVSERLEDVDEPRLADILLVVSELASNAVQHGGTEFELCLEHSPAEVRIEITDGNGGEPVVRTPDSGQPNGRGMQIVTSLSDRWGVVRSARDAGREMGKTVWVVFARGKAPTVQPPPLLHAGPPET